MNIHQSILRGVGLAVALVMLAFAIQLLLLGFEASPLIGGEQLDDLTSWLRRRPLVGAGLLAGIGILAVSAGLWWSIARSFGVDRRVITVRERDGWTKLDLPTLEDAIERDLESVDRRNDVTASIGRSGSTRLKITTPDPSAKGPVDELRQRFATLCRERGVPCRLGRVTVSTPRRRTGRRRIR